MPQVKSADHNVQKCAVVNLWISPSYVHVLFWNGGYYTGHTTREANTKDVRKTLPRVVRLVKPGGRSTFRNGLETGPETSDLSWAKPIRPVGRILAFC